MKYVISLILIFALLAYTVSEAGCQKTMDAAGDVMGGFMTWVISIILLALIVLGAQSLTNNK